ncbi:beta-mannosidase [Promicromonospora sp. AC04]|uniref:glycoside hydrolase family 2 protein n=1 Tax=Promicromonospora sp. AC04 TaxID=2135723 RepID=UPI000D44CD3A|nr:glycoside hydrolase family 2 protein [Promicromonospora sp. AC04]PUB20817.1 beta-mannosidase [Promicromonospora sp. AC04]
MTPTLLAGLPATIARRELHEGWTVRAVGGPVAEHVRVVEVPASVPGSIHTDLLGAGLIPDPYLDDHESLVAWVSRCDWEYRTTFPWSAQDTPGADHHDLVFDGLDTVATVLLNGTEVAQTRNQHRTYRVPVADLLEEGDNELVVSFASPVRYADRESLALSYLPHVNKHPFNAIRKAACNFGWDWGIDAATVGIWRPVRLESWHTARLASVRPLATADLAGGTTADGGAASTGRLAVHLDIERHAATGPLEATVLLRGHGTEHRATASLEPGASTAVVHLEVHDAALWWPRGHGDQPLYDVEVTIAAPGGEPLDQWAGRTGFRSVRLDMVPDEHGTSFTIVVNDQPVWVKGANWIPDDVFFHRVDRARYAQRIAQAEQANINLLRVWGGGIYESNDFFDLCDERGILTWQDFAFACAAYSEDEALRSEVDAEARDNVARLAAHPSLVLWNGSNENIWGIKAWGWEKRLDGKNWGLGYYTELLPSVLAELNETRPYTPSSPWSGSLRVPANDPDHGSMHSWEVWNREDWTRYRDTVPRFMAEFGWQGPPTWSTLTRAISDDPLTPESPGMLVHQKAANGNDKLTDGLVAHLPLPDDMDDWHWAMSWNQATAVQVGVEHLRSWSPMCSGSIVWQLNDCWPVTSWAAVDGGGRAKPLLYALRHAYADRLLTVQPRTVGTGAQDGIEEDGRSLVVAVVNDSPDAWAGGLVVRRSRYDGTQLAQTTLSVKVGPRGTSTVTVPDDVAEAVDPASEILIATLGDATAVWYYAEPRDSALADPDLQVEVTTTDDGARVHVTAGALVRGLALLADKVHPGAVVDDMLVDLLPGESVTFHVTSPEPLDPAALVGPLVLRSVNQLVVGKVAPLPAVG